jgi:hypothetical protein
MQRYAVYFIWKLVYMFRVVTPPIIRSAYNCIYSIWYLSHRYRYLRCRGRVGTGFVEELEQIPDAVDTVVCAFGDGWWYHPKHVDQFSDKINRVTLHLVGYRLEVKHLHDLRQRDILFFNLLHCILVWCRHQTGHDISLYSL